MAKKAYYNFLPDSSEINYKLILRALFKTKGNAFPVFLFLINDCKKMDFQVAELTEQVAHTAREFSLQKIKPYIMEWDESQTFPVEIFRQLGELGLMGVLVPEEYGGAGLSYH